jgi:uncharacterized protein
MIKNIVLQQKEECESLLDKDYVDRIDETTKAQYRSTQLIKLITGPRRAGKSVLALQVLKGSRFAYLNFDDDLLLKHFAEDGIIQSLVEAYGTYQYLLLDEVQNLPGWELWVNKLYRRGANLFITGSNARLLSRELATPLTGRFIQIPVLPFSFTEALRFKGIEIPSKADEVSPSSFGKLLHHLNQYIRQGGFPETLITPEIQLNYLRTLFDSILLSDIIKRFRIRQTQQLLDLANYLLTNYTNPYSANELKTVLGFNSVATTQKYIGYLEEPYLFFNLPRYATKLKSQLKSPRKSYIVDNGFIHAGSFELSPNSGRLLENMVFVELLRRGYQPGLSLFYYRSRFDKEVDFVCRNGHQTEQLIQVCYDLSHPKTLKRETDALLEASKALGCTKLLIITWDSEEQTNGQGVNISTALKWLLGL